MAVRCIYPDCNCPFDAPGDPNWCAHGPLPRKVAYTRIGSSGEASPTPYSAMRINSEWSRWGLVETDGVVEVLVYDRRRAAVSWAMWPIELDKLPVDERRRHLAAYVRAGRSALQART